MNTDFANLLAEMALTVRAYDPILQAAEDRRYGQSTLTKTAADAWLIPRMAVGGTVGAVGGGLLAKYIRDRVRNSRDVKDKGDTAHVALGALLGGVAGAGAGGMIGRQAWYGPGDIADSKGRTLQDWKDYAGTHAPKSMGETVTDFVGLPRPAFTASAIGGTGLAASKLFGGMNKAVLAEKAKDLASLAPANRTFEAITASKKGNPTLESASALSRTSQGSAAAYAIYRAMVNAGQATNTLYRTVTGD